MLVSGFRPLPEISFCFCYEQEQRHIAANIAKLPELLGRN
jgi:hypothetical protein